jgi:hypothetical protein
MVVVVWLLVRQEEKEKKNGGFKLSRSYIDSQDRLYYGRSFLINPNQPTLEKITQ